MENYITDFSYENCFWGNRNCLYEHLSSKYKEYLSIASVNINIADSIEKFCKSLNLSKNKYSPYKENDTSTRGKGIKIALNFINKIIDKLKQFADNLISISNKIYEREISYNSKKEAKKMCDESLKKYENSLKTLITKRNSYYDSVNQIIEQFLNNKYKNKEKDKNMIDLKKDNIIKKKKEYKDQLLKTENFRIEYIELQRNIFSSEEEFERDCTNEIKEYFKKIFLLYNDLLKSSQIDNEVNDILEKMDGCRDNQIFAANNRTIISCPARIEFSEYNQDVDSYSNLEVYKNQLKNKNKEETKAIKFQVSSEVKKFLNDILQNTSNDNNSKLQEIVDKMLNSNIKEEDFDALIKLFQDSYDDFKKWEKENVGLLEFKKVGEKWDNRFFNMQLFLDSFNRARMNNKELNNNNFDFFTKAMEKILYFNDNENIDYKLCELLITLSSTFYTTENINGQEVKKYPNEVIKNTSPLIQKVNFWVGLTKYELNEEFMKEKNKKQNINNNLNKINSIITNLNSKIIPLLKKKNKGNKENDNKQNQNIIAKIMSISYNLVQFISKSDTLNEILANIFRNFKVSEENKEMIIDMVNSHLESEGIKNITIDKKMLMVCDNIEYFFNSKENIKDKEIEKDKNNSINEVEENDFENNNKDKKLEENINNIINYNNLEKDKDKDNS